jgi:hypothetical protein
MDVRQILTDMVNAGKIPAARSLAEQLRGASLAQAQELASSRTYFGTVAHRREQLVEWAIGWALNSAAIRFHNLPESDRAAFLARYRDARLDEMAG